MNSRDDRVICITCGAISYRPDTSCGYCGHTSYFRPNPEVDEE